VNAGLLSQLAMNAGLSSSRCWVIRMEAILWSGMAQISISGRAVKAEKLATCIEKRHRIGAATAGPPTLELVGAVLERAKP